VKYDEWSAMWEGFEPNERASHRYRLIADC
jgi:hypothetical protein